MYTPLYTKQTTSTYCNSTGNYTQYFLMLYKGKESEKEHKVIDKKDESLCCVPETNTILQLNHTSFFFKV